MRFNVFWYVVHVKLNRASKLVHFFNKQEATVAFIPKKEQWFNIKGVKDYVVRDLYPDYVFIKSQLNKEEFEKQFNNFFKTVEGFVDLLEYDEVYSLKKEEQAFFEKLFGEGDIIRHSVGSNVNRRFKANSGPLKGLEDAIVKVNRHGRFATLKSGLFNGKFTVAIEVERSL